MSRRSKRSLVGEIASVQKGEPTLTPELKTAIEKRKAGLGLTPLEALQVEDYRLHMRSKALAKRKVRWAEFAQGRKR